MSMLQPVSIFFYSKSLRDAKLTLMIVLYYFRTNRFLTRKQAQEVLDRYILPGGQQNNAESIKNALNRLLGREG